MLNRSIVVALSSAALMAPQLQAPPAHGATTIGTATAWAAFARPDPWVKPTDNVHWYVATPRIDSSALGKALTITVTSPKSIDCANLGAGYQAAGDWSAAAIQIRTCTATRAVVDITPTAAMVGAKVTLTGWSAVGSRRTATIRGTVRVAGATRTATSSATRTTAPKPVGPLVRIGTWRNQPVHSSSLNGINEIWVGKGPRAVRHMAPDGDAWHIGMTGARVDVWTMDGSTPVGWHLDLTTGRVTTQKLPTGTIGKQGTPGFWLIHDGSMGTTSGEATLYDWAGQRFFTVSMFATRPGRNLGFTATHGVGIRGGQAPSEVVFFPLDGTEMQVVRVSSGAAWVTGGVVDATGVAVNWHEPGVSGTRTCRLEPGWTSCQPI